MLWQKSWWETRWGFLTILGLTLLLVALTHPWDPLDPARWALRLQQWAPPQQGESGWEEKRRFLTLLSGWPGYAWMTWFRLLAFFWPFCSVMITTALVKSSCVPIGAPLSAAALFTVSLPVSRRKALLTLAAVLAIEMTLIALVPSLMYAITIRSTGRWVPVGSTVMYALLLALGGMVFVAFTFLLIAIFNSQWKAVVIGISTVFFISILNHAFGIMGFHV